MGRGAAENACGYNYKKHGMEWTCGECGSRERQSPIDFPANAPWGAAMAKIGAEFYFSYETMKGNFLMQNVQNGTDGTLTIDVSNRGIGGVTMHGNMFNVKSISFHVGSEHTFKGKRLPLELHIHHASDTDNAHELVVAIPFDTTAPPNPPASAALAGLRRTMPPAGGGHVTLELLQPADLIQPLIAGGAYFMYTGSQTVPPCREQVTYLVRQEPLPMLTEDLAIRTQITSANDGAENWRGTMPLMGRLISTMLAKPGLPPLVSDMVILPGQVPPVGKLGSRTAVMTGEHIGRAAFDIGFKASAVAQGIYQALANPAQVIAAPAPAPFAPAR